VHLFGFTIGIYYDAQTYERHLMTVTSTELHHVARARTKTSSAVEPYATIYLMVKLKLQEALKILFCLDELILSFLFNNGNPLSVIIRTMELSRSSIT
jgi:hypothetical protein